MVAEILDRTNSNTDSNDYTWFPGQLEQPRISMKKFVEE